jgi:hypothetical protein
VPSDRDVITRFGASRYVNLETLYVRTFVAAGCGRGWEGRKNKSYTLRRMLLQYRVKRAVLQVWPIQASMPLKSKRMQNTLTFKNRASYI